MSVLEVVERFCLIDNHMISLQKLEQKFQTDAKRGLTKQQAKDRLQIGPNICVQGEVDWLFALRQLRSGLSSVVWALCALYVIGDSLFGDGRYIQTVFTVSSLLVMAVAAITYFCTNKSLKEKEEAAAAAKVRVIREGQQETVTAGELCQGDLVIVKAGDVIPADLRIVECNNLYVHNGMVNGEINPVLLNASSSEEPIMQAKNVAFATTPCIEGEGKGIVIGTSKLAFLNALNSVSFLTTNKYQLIELPYAVNKLVKKVSNPLVFLALALYVLKRFFGVELNSFFGGNSQGQVGSAL